MKASDLREKSVEDLRELQASLARDTFQNRLKNFTNRLDDTSQIRKTKRDLARVITLLRERGAGSTSAPAAKALKASPSEGVKASASVDAKASPSEDAKASPSEDAKASPSKASSSAKASAKPAASAKAQPSEAVAVETPAEEAPKKKKAA